MSSKPPRPGSRPSAGRPRPSAGKRPTAGGASSRPSANRPAQGGESWSPGRSLSEPKKQAPEPEAPKKVKRPDGTGMLNMKSLNEDEDDAPPQSGTQFFSIPKAKRKPKPPPKTPAASPQASNAGRGLASGGPVAGGPVAGGPVAGGPVIGGPVAGGSVAGPPKIGGPIAGGPVASPFAGSAPSMPDHHGSESRAKSWRVLAVVLAMVTFVCAMLVVTVGLVAYGVMNPSGDEDNGTTPVAVAPATPSKPPTEVIDTGSAPAPEPVKPKPVRPRPQPVVGGGGSTPSKPKPATPSKPKLGAGTAKIRLKEPGSYTQIEVKCTEPISTDKGPTKRHRVNFDGSGVATVTGMPSSTCQIYFRGGMSMTNSSVTAPADVTCGLAGTQMICN